jgi:hypothetical protein
MSAAEVDNDGTANANWGTLVVVLMVVIVSLTISFVCYNGNASSFPVSAKPAAVQPVLSPGPANNYNSAGGGAVTPKATP